MSVAEALLSKLVVALTLSFTLTLEAAKEALLDQLSPDGSVYQKIQEMLDHALVNISSVKDRIVFLNQLTEWVNEVRGRR